MAILTQTLYQDILGELYIGDNTTNKGIFIRSVNRALSELSIQTDLATRLTHIDDVDGTIGVSQDMEYVVRTGTAFWMVRTGATPADPKVVNALLSDTDKRWTAAKGDFWTLTWNTIQAVHTNDVVALGHLDTT